MWLKQFCTLDRALATSLTLSVTRTYHTYLLKVYKHPSEAVTPNCLGSALLSPSRITITFTVDLFVLRQLRSGHYYLSTYLPTTYLLPYLPISNIDLLLPCSHGCYCWLQSPTAKDEQEPEG